LVQIKLKPGRVYQTDDNGILHLLKRYKLWIFLSINNQFMCIYVNIIHFLFSDSHIIKDVYSKMSTSCILIHFKVTVFKEAHLSTKCHFSGRIVLNY
jgi:hypothetical protein